MNLIQRDVKTNHKFFRYLDSIEYRSSTTRTVAIKWNEAVSYISDDKAIKGVTQPNFVVVIDRIEGTA
jgi:hypothetical protein